MPSRYLAAIAAQLGPRPRPHRGARQPGAAAGRRRAGSARARHLRLRRPPDARRRRSGRARGDRRGRGAKLVLVGDGAERRALEAIVAARQLGGSSSRSRALCRATRCLRISPGRVPQSSRAPGRTCRTPPSRRSPSARPWSRPPSAASRRSCTTARTACSYRRTIPRPSQARCARILDDDALRARLAAAAKPSVAAIGRDVDLRAARADPRRGRPGDAARVSSSGAAASRCRSRRGSRKWDALSEVLDLRVLNAGAGTGDPRFALLPDSAAAFYPRLPLEVARALRAFPAQVIVASDPYVGVAALARPHAGAIAGAGSIVEVHGDPRTFTRAYGSPARRLVSARSRRSRSLGHPKRRRDARAVCVHVVARRRGDADIRRRRASPRTATWRRSAIRRSCPSPTLAASCSSGALETYKNVDGLAAAWRRVAQRQPDAVLTVVGRGSRHEVIDRFVAELPAQVEHIAELQPVEVAARIDAAAGARSSVVSGGARPCRARGVRARPDGRSARTAAGSRTWSTDGVDALLIPRGDTDALVAALRARPRGQGPRRRARCVPPVRPMRAWHQTRRATSRMRIARSSTP